MDNCYICYGDLTVLTTANNGIIKYENYEFKLNVPKWTMTCYRIANAGANCIRLIPYGVWLCPSREAIFTPFKFCEGKWDLNVWNPKYFIIVQKVVEIAKQYGLTVWFDLFDNCQKYTPQDSPFWNNHQNINGFYDSRCDVISANWIMSIHDILKNTDAIYGCGNELEWDGIELCRRVIYPTLKELAIHPSKIAYGAQYQLGTDYNNKTMEWMKGYAEEFWGEDRNYIIRPTHNILSPSNTTGTAPYGQQVKEVLDSWGHNPLRMSLSDDGTFDGTSACDYFIFNGQTQRRPSANDWKGLCQYVMTHYPTMVNGHPKFVFEHCPKSTDIEGCQVQTMTAISEAYNQAYGRFPSNYNKYQKPDLKKQGEQVEPEEPSEMKNWYLYVALVFVILFIILTLCC